jgi:hypothetical protein
MMKAKWVGIAGLDGSAHFDNNENKRFGLEVKAAKVNTLGSKY